ncbi:MAG: TRAP transporter small permease subunit [Zestosphaera sp.]
MANLVDKLSTKLAFLNGYLALVLTFLVTYGVICRYFLREPDVRVFFISNWILGIVFLFGFGYTLLTKGHISMDIVYMHLPPKAKHALDILSLLSIIACCIAILPNTVVLSWRSTLMWEMDSTMPVFAPPIWWYKWILVFALILAVLQASSLLVKTVRKRK